MPEALAFDMYGTLVDPIRISEQLERHLPDAAPRVTQALRQKQLEYTFRLTAMQRYEPFDHVIRKSLDYSLVASEDERGDYHRDVLIAH